jgi:glycerol uptake facilitator-like aquaporin
MSGTGSTPPLQPYVAEFLGTLIFLLLVFVIVSKFPNSQPQWVVAALVGCALALGVLVALLLKGPGYLNPSLAVTQTVANRKTSAYLSAMIGVELLAALVAILLWNAGLKQIAGRPALQSTAYTAYPTAAYS